MKLTLLILVILSVILTGCATVSKCGLPPPGAKIEAGYWDPDRERRKHDDLVYDCNEMLDQKSVEKTVLDVTLPKIDAFGVVNVSVGGFKLETNYAVKYEKLSSVDYHIVNSAKLACQNALDKYSCIVYTNPSNDPMRDYANKLYLTMTEAFKAKEAVKNLLLLYEKEPDAQKRDEIKSKVKEHLDKVPEKFPEPGGVPSDKSAEVSVVSPTVAIDILSVIVVADSDRFSEELSILKRQVVDLERANAEIREMANTALGQLAECKKSIEKERERVEGNRLALVEALKGASVSAILGDQSVYTPFRLVLASDGFGECQTAMPTDMAKSVKAIVKALTSFDDGKVARQLAVDVWGFSDEQPLLKGTNLACNPYSGNKALAAARAEAVRRQMLEAVAAQRHSAASWGTDSFGSDDSFVVRCYQQHPNDLDAQQKCHSKNRRFELRIGGQSFVAAPPKACTT